jgi:pimeloyl-ACP methyl ester carboxylesterase
MEQLVVRCTHISPHAIVSGWEDADCRYFSNARYGPSDFYPTGTLKDWSIIDDLHKISCPTLLISGVNDEITVPVIVPWFTNIQKVKWVELQNSSHLPMYEEPKRCVELSDPRLVSMISFFYRYLKVILDILV